jgi:hypothetical protein
MHNVQKLSNPKYNTSVFHNREMKQYNIIIGSGDYLKKCKVVSPHCD